MPLKNLPVDPNTLGMWDDGLVAAWKANHRFTLLMGVQDYPPHIDSIRYWIGLHTDCECGLRSLLMLDKPPQDVIIATTRGQGLPGFYMSGPLLNYLKSFPRSFKLRTAYGMSWSNADKIGLDEELSRMVFQYGEFPEIDGAEEVDDPVERGYERNVPLCAFYWILRRFTEATKYCLVGRDSE